MPGGEAADDGVAGPAQRGDREQEIRLVDGPVSGRRCAWGLIGSGHGVGARSLLAAQYAAAPPGVPPGRWLLPGPDHRHGFSRPSNGDGCIATMHPAVIAQKQDCGWLAGVAVAIGLASDHLLGEMDQHPLAAMVLQFAKRPQQAQVEQRLQRTAALLRRMVLPGLSGT
jgi:hypothetical protein